jgi:rhamnogalacturonyl hydrolase YesR
MGYSEALHSEYRNEILDDYLAMCDALLRYKRPDGGFSWHIPAVDGAADTSASAMIGYCLADGLSLGVFGNDMEKYNKAVLDVQNFILKNTKNGYVMSSLSGCEDLAVHRQIYGHYPFGQGAALSFLASCPAAV